MEQSQSLWDWIKLFDVVIKTQKVPMMIEDCYFCRNFMVGYVRKCVVKSDTMGYNVIKDGGKYDNDKNSECEC